MTAGWLEDGGWRSTLREFPTPIRLARVHAAQLVRRDDTLVVLPIRLGVCMPRNAGRREPMPPR